MSIVIPLMNERENLPELEQLLRGVLDELPLPGEVILVDDGSTDGSFELLRETARRDSRFRVIRFRRNYGQTAAMSAGFDYARGDVIVPLDADLQNDPRDIPLLLAKLDDGFDVVSGWRISRKDALLSRLLPSRAANWIISRMTGIHLHDHGCSLKAYRAEVLHDLRMYGDMHRLIPAYAAIEGARVAEVPIRHHARKAGKSKYGNSRWLRVVLDLLVVRFMAVYRTRPMHLFGTVGLALCGAGCLAGAGAIAERLLTGVRIHRNPLLLLAVFVFLLGAQFLFAGLLAEIQVRTYHESSRRSTYRIRETANLDDEPQ